MQYLKLADFYFKYMYVINSFGSLDPGNRPQKYHFEKNQLGGAHLPRFHVLDMHKAELQER